MRTGVVRILDVMQEAHRLTGGFHVSEDEQAVATLRRLRGPMARVRDLVKGRGVFRGPIYRAILADRSHGEPYVSARDLVNATVTPTSYLSQKHGRLLDELRLQEGMILVTCSGMNLGTAIWARPDFDGLVASGDLIRIEPDPAAAPPGFLFAFLASRHGFALIRKQIYGGHIKHVDPEHIANLPVPRLGQKAESKAHSLVVEAANLRSIASRALNEAIGSVERTLHAPQHNSTGTQPISQLIMSSTLRSDMRFEGYYYNPRALAVDNWALTHPNGNRSLGEVADVFDVPPFKHIYVEPGYGPPFFTSGDLFLLNRHAEKYLSRTRTRDLGKYVIERGWVLLARSGQLGGILGRPQFADSALHRACTSDHVIRVVAKTVPAGYLYAYLATPSIGYVSLTRTMTGASVPALWPSYLKKLRIVNASTRFMSDTHEAVTAAFEDRVKATALEDEARRIVEQAIEGAS